MVVISVLHATFNRSGVPGDGIGLRVRGHEPVDVRRGDALAILQPSRSSERDPIVLTQPKRRLLRIDALTPILPLYASASW